MSTALIGQLQEIREQHGTLTPRLLVDLARDPEHPLHSRFDWNDTAAAEKWRLEQAGALLRVTYKPDASRPTELRAFAAVRGDNTPTTDYVPTDQVAADPFLSELWLRQMKREWKAFEARYKHHAEFVAYVREQIQGAAS